MSQSQRGCDLNLSLLTRGGKGKEAVRIRADLLIRPLLYMPANYFSEIFLFFSMRRGLYL